MDLKSYLMHPGISSSSIRAFLKCPAKMASKSKIRTPAMIVGSAVHAMVEGIFNEAFAVAPSLDRRTKDGKVAFAEFQTANAGKDILTAEQYEAVEGMALRVLDRLDGRFGFANRESEPSLFWTDAESGLKCKARPDLIIDGIDPIVVELKTTTDASPDAWFYKVRSMDYTIQAIHHRAGLEAVRGERMQYIWVVVETEPPYATAMYVLQEGVRYQADLIRYRDALHRIKQCINDRHYPEYESSDFIW